MNRILDKETCHKSAVLVSLYRWAFNPLYDDQSIISVYIDFIKHP